MNDGPVAFHDLPRSRFPFTIEFLTLAGDIVHTITVTGPGAVRIPGLAAQHGPISVRITWPDGVETWEP